MQVMAAFLGGPVIFFFFPLVFATVLSSKDLRAKHEFLHFHSLPDFATFPVL